MSLLVVQLASVLILLVGTFVSGILPILWFRLRRRYHEEGTDEGPITSSKIVIFFIYFGGGVLLGTSFLHLFPEAREGMVGHHETKPDYVAELRSFSNSTAHLSAGLTVQDKQPSSAKAKGNTGHHHHESFPIPEFVLLCGFFATYLIDIVIRSFLLPDGTSDRKQSTVPVQFCTCAQRITECSRAYKEHRIERADLLASDKKRRRSSTWAGEASPKIRGTDHAPGRHPPDILQSSVMGQPYRSYGSVAAGGTGGLPMKVEGGITIVNRPVAIHPNLPIIKENAAEPQPTSVSFSALLTIVALSFHSILEGFVVGFQESAVSTWTLLLAISMHKFIIAFVIGFESIASGCRIGVIVPSIAVFSSISPIGVSVAMSLKNNFTNISDTVIGTVNCLATGTLLYVTFYEILRGEGKHFCGGLRFLATLIGVAVIAGIQYLTSVL